MYLIEVKFFGMFHDIFLSVFCHGIPMSLPCFSHVFPMIYPCVSMFFPCFSHVFPMFSHVFPMFSHVFPCFPMVFPWFSHGFPMFSHGFPRVFPWFSVRSPRVPWTWPCAKQPWANCTWWAPRWRRATSPRREKVPWNLQKWIHCHVPCLNDDT